MNRYLVLAVVAVAACRSAPSAVLVRIDAETPGDNCAAGGVAVRTGTDASGDGVLDDAEVNASQTRFVCNGAPGAAGQPGTPGQPGDAGTSGFNALNRFSTEAAGANCANGGTRVESGLDLDNDGALGANEVTNTAYICNDAAVDDVFYGNLVVRADTDLQLLQGKRVLVGNLEVRHAPGGVLTLSTLEIITGEVRVGDDSQGELRALTPVRELHFPALKAIGELRVSSSPDVTVLDFPALQRASRLSFLYLDGVTTLSFPALTHADSIELESNVALTTFTAPLLQSLLSLYVYDNTVLTTFTVSALTEVSEYFGVRYNAALNDCFVWRVLAQMPEEPRFGVSVYDNDVTVTCAAADICFPVTAEVPTLTFIRECVRPTPFAAARTTCQSLGAGADLAWFENATEWSTFAAAVNTGDLSEGWFGYSDAAMDGTWTALSGFSTFNPVTEPNFWAPGEPNGGANENAAEILWNGANDGDATQLRRFFCRVP